MKAIVTKPFDGVRDGEALPVSFKKGDVVEGDLALTAIKFKNAQEAKDEPEELQPLPPREIPRSPEHKAEARAHFDRLSDDDVRKLAEDLKIDVSQGMGDRNALFEKAYDVSFPETPKS